MFNKRALLGACGLLVAVLAFRSFYIQELFFAFLLFAIVFSIFLLMAACAFGLLYLYTKAMAYLAVRVSVEGHRALPLFRVLVLWFAPAATKTSQTLLAGHRVVFYPLFGLLDGWFQSFRRDVAQFRDDTERAVKHLRLLLKHN